MKHFARKSLGQHFLIDQQVLQQIVRALNLQANDTFVEIGPGLGALTLHVLPLVPALSVIEFDRHVIPLLEAECEGLGNLEVHQADVLTVNFTELAEQHAGKKLYVFGNLPYNISTPIIFHLLEHLEVIDEMCFMLQEEVVDRIIAHPNTKTYGRLSVMVQYYFHVEKLLHVPPTAFEPPPKVNSAVVRLVPKPHILKQSLDRTLFGKLVNIAFQQRRKTIRNSLHTLVSVEILEKAGINPKLRAENLSVEDYVNLTKYL